MMLEHDDTAHCELPPDNAGRAASNDGSRLPSCGVICGSAGSAGNAGNEHCPQDG